ncbi:MAG: hypothetical protein ACI9Y8_000111 [Candidatus Omnitrophota bacterium]|jgi:hypothetical protein
MTVEQLCFAAPVGQLGSSLTQLIGSQNKPQTLLSLVDLVQNPVNIKPTFKYAHVQNIHQGTNGKLIIHIQDAHANFSGQMNLAKTIDDLMTKYGIKLVLAEGGEGDASLSTLRSKMTTRDMDAAANRLLMDGMIAGHEYLDLTSKHKMKLVGIENKELYLSNLKAYSELTQTRKKITAHLHKIKVAIQRLKNKLYSKDILELESIEEFNKQFEALLQLNDGRIQLSTYPQMQLLKNLKSEEKLIDFDRLNLEREALFDLLSAKGQSEALRKLVQDMRQGQSSQITQSFNMRKLFELAHQNQIQMQRFYNLQKYNDYLKEFVQLDFNHLLEEVDEFQTLLYQNLFQGEKDPSILRAIDVYKDLLDKATQIQMTSREFQTFMANEEKFDEEAWQAFLNQKLLDLEYYDNLIPFKEELTEFKQKLKNFYRLVNQRDEAFIQNISKVLNQEDEQAAFLVTGGYHTQNLTKLVQAEGYSFITLSPKVTSETNHQQYESLLLKELNQSISSGAQTKSPMQVITTTLVQTLSRMSQVRIPEYARRFSNERFGQVAQMIVDPRSASRMTNYPNKHIFNDYASMIQWLKIELGMDDEQIGVVIVDGPAASGKKAVAKHLSDNGEVAHFKMDGFASQAMRNALALALGFFIGPLLLGRFLDRFILRFFHDHEAILDLKQQIAHAIKQVEESNAESVEVSPQYGFKNLDPESAIKAMQDSKQTVKKSSTIIVSGLRGKELLGTGMPQQQSILVTTDWNTTYNRYQDRQTQGNSKQFWPWALIRQFTASFKWEESFFARRQNEYDFVIDSTNIDRPTVIDQRNLTTDSTRMSPNSVPFEGRARMSNPNNDSLPLPAGVDGYIVDPGAEGSGRDLPISKSGARMTSSSTEHVAEEVPDPLATGEDGASLAEKKKVTGKRPGRVRQVGHVPLESKNFNLIMEFIKRYRKIDSDTIEYSTYLRGINPLLETLRQEPRARRKETRALLALTEGFIQKKSHIQPTLDEIMAVAVASFSIPLNSHLLVIYALTLKMLDMTGKDLLNAQQISQFEKELHALVDLYSSKHPQEKNINLATIIRQILSIQMKDSKSNLLSQSQWHFSSALQSELAKIELQEMGQALRHDPSESIGRIQTSHHALKLGAQNNQIANVVDWTHGLMSQDHRVRRMIRSHEASEIPAKSSIQNALQPTVNAVNDNLDTLILWTLEALKKDDSNNQTRDKKKPLIAQTGVSRYGLSCKSGSACNQAAARWNDEHTLDDILESRELLEEFSMHIGQTNQSHASFTLNYGQIYEHTLQRLIYLRAADFPFDASDSDAESISANLDQIKSLLPKEYFKIYKLIVSGTASNSLKAIQLMEASQWLNESLLAELYQYISRDLLSKVFVHQDEASIEEIKIISKDNNDGIIVNVNPNGLAEVFIDNRQYFDNPRMITIPLPDHAGSQVRLRAQRDSRSFLWLHAFSVSEDLFLGQFFYDSERREMLHEKKHFKSRVLKGHEGVPDMPDSVPVTMQKNEMGNYFAFKYEDKTYNLSRPYEARYKGIRDDADLQTIHIRIIRQQNKDYVYGFLNPDDELASDAFAKWLWVPSKDGGRHRFEAEYFYVPGTKLWFYHLLRNNITTSRIYQARIDLDDKGQAIIHKELKLRLGDMFKGGGQNMPSEALMTNTLADPSRVDIYDAPESEDKKERGSFDPRQMRFIASKYYSKPRSMFQRDWQIVTQRHNEFLSDSNLIVPNPDPVVVRMPIGVDTRAKTGHPKHIIDTPTGKPITFEKTEHVDELVMIRFNQFKMNGRIQRGIELIALSEDFVPKFLIRRGYYHAPGDEFKWQSPRRRKSYTIEERYQIEEVLIHTGYLGSFVHHMTIKADYLTREFVQMVNNELQLAQIDVEKVLDEYNHVLTELDKIKAFLLKQNWESSEMDKHFGRISDVISPVYRQAIDQVQRNQQTYPIGTRVRFRHRKATVEGYQSIEGGVILITLKMDDMKRKPNLEDRLETYSLSSIVEELQFLPIQQHPTQSDTTTHPPSNDDHARLAAPQLTSSEDSGPNLATFDSRATRLAGSNSISKKSIVGEDIFKQILLAVDLDLPVRGALVPELKSLFVRWFGRARVEEDVYAIGHSGNRFSRVRIYSLGAKGYHVLDEVTGERLNISLEEIAAYRLDLKKNGSQPESIMQRLGDADFSYNALELKSSIKRSLALLRQGIGVVAALPKKLVRFKMVTDFASIKSAIGQNMEYLYVMSEDRRFSQRASHVFIGTVEDQLALDAYRENLDGDADFLGFVNQIQIVGLADILRNYDVNSSPRIVFASTPKSFERAYASNKDFRRLVDVDLVSIAPTSAAANNELLDMLNLLNTADILAHWAQLSQEEQAEHQVHIGRYLKRAYQIDGSREHIDSLSYASGFEEDTHWYQRISLPPLGRYVDAIFHSFIPTIRNAVLASA